MESRDCKHKVTQILLRPDVDEELIPARTLVAQNIRTEHPSFMKYKTRQIPPLRQCHLAEPKLRRGGLEFDLSVPGYFSFDALAVSHGVCVCVFIYWSRDGDCRHHEGRGTM